MTQLKTATRPAARRTRPQRRRGRWRCTAQMLLARAVDERMWLMQRAGKIAFIISGRATRVRRLGITWPMRKGLDWMRRSTAPSPRA